MKPVIICGSDPRTRGNIPWREDAEFWVLNEAASKPTPIGADGKPLTAEQTALNTKPVRLDPPWPKKVDAVFQMHLPAIYTSLKNLSDPNHWAWLQQPHDFPIYMQDVDERVPASVKFPLDEITADLLGGVDLLGEPLRYFTSSIVYALALAIHQGRDLIKLYGCEMDAGTEYEYQRACVLFWIGLAAGRGIKVELHSGAQMFDPLLYGYEGDLESINAAFLTQRRDELKKEYDRLAKRADHANKAVQQAIKAGKANDLDIRISEAEEAHLDWGKVAGALGEAERHLAKVATMEGAVVLPRQEFELAAAQAQLNNGIETMLTHRTGGKVEYVWYVWKDNTTNPDAIGQLQAFIKQQMTHAYRAGAYTGTTQENVLYMMETDKKIRMAGGSKALAAI